MRIAALYDIHGNLDALEAVLEDVRAAHADLVVAGGDVFPGPFAREALELLGSLAVPVRWISGNGDRAVLEERAGHVTTTLPEGVRQTTRWHAAALRDDEAQTMQSWPATLRLDVDGLRRVLFVHATPDSDTDIFTERTPVARLRHLMRSADADVVVCGHTHLQFDVTVDATRIVNAGSVGMPFGEPGAYWALLGPDVSLRRTVYDTARAAARIRSSAYPGADDFASQFVESAPSKDAMLDVYRRFD